MSPCQVMAVLLRARRFAATGGIRSYDFLPALLIETFSLPFLRMTAHVPVIERLYRAQDVSVWIDRNLPPELIRCEDAEHPPENMSVAVLREILECVARGKLLRERRRKQLDSKVYWSRTVADALVVGCDLIMVGWLGSLIMAHDYSNVVSSALVYLTVMFVGQLCVYSRRG